MARKKVRKSKAGTANAGEVEAVKLRSVEAIVGDLLKVMQACDVNTSLLHESEMGQLRDAIGGTVDQLVKVLNVVELFCLNFAAKQVAAHTGSTSSTFSKTCTSYLRDLPNPPVRKVGNAIEVTRHTENFVANLSAAIGILKALADPDYCSLRIAAWPSVLSKFLPAVYEDIGVASGLFFHEFPKAEVRSYLIDDHFDVAGKLWKTDVDIVLCEGKERPEGDKNTQLECERLLTADPIGLLVPRTNHLMKDGSIRRQRSEELQEWCAKIENKKHTDNFDPRWLSAFAFFDVEGTDRQQMMQASERLGQQMSHRIEVATTREQLECVINHQLGICFGHEPEDDVTRSKVFYIPLVKLAAKAKDAEAQHLEMLGVQPFKVCAIFRTCDKVHLSEDSLPTSSYGRLFRRVMTSMRKKAKGWAWRAT